MTKLITIDKDHYDDLVKAQDALAKIREAHDMISLWYFKPMPFGHRHYVYILGKDDTISRLKKELDLCKESINEKVQIIQEIKATSIPVFNFTNRLVDDIIKK